MKSSPLTLRLQRGATLIVGLIMLAVITLMVTAAFTLSDTNLKAVGNMQFRDEATAAANLAIENVITGSTEINPSPASGTFNVDIDNDGQTDYTVAVTATCIASSVVAEGSGIGQQGSVELPGLSVGGVGGGNFQTVWNIEALATSNATGARVRVHQGVRRILPADCA
jgi:hypothetical protein